MITCFENFTSEHTQLLMLESAVLGVLNSLFAVLVGCVVGVESREASASGATGVRVVKARHY